MTQINLRMIDLYDWIKWFNSGVCFFRWYYRSRFGSWSGGSCGKWNCCSSGRITFTQEVEQRVSSRCSSSVHCLQDWSLLELFYNDNPPQVHQSCSSISILWLWALCGLWFHTQFNMKWHLHFDSGFFCHAVEGYVEGAKAQPVPLYVGLSTL